jgi:hypothetical protein
MKTDGAALSASSLSQAEFSRPENSRLISNRPAILVRSHAIAGQVVENILGGAERWLGIDHPVLPAEFGEEAAECTRKGKLLQRTMELEPFLLEEFTKPHPEPAAEAAAKCLDGQEEACRRIDPSGTIGSQAAGGNDVVDMGMVTSTPTIP